jgi:hypothetical protein
MYRIETTDAGTIIGGTSDKLRQPKFHYVGLENHHAGPVPIPTVRNFGGQRVSRQKGQLFALFDFEVDCDSPNNNIE